MGSLLLPRSDITPSYAAGYARSAGESANPGLWDGRVFANALTLGPTGATIRDLSGYNRHGTLLGDPGSDWVMTPNGWALDFDGSNNNTEGPSLGHAVPFTAGFLCESDIANYTANGYAFHQYDSAGGNRNWAIIARSTTDTWGFSYGKSGGASGVSLETDIDIETDGPHSIVAVVVSLTKVNFYYDGVYADSGTMSGYDPAIDSKHGIGGIFNHASANFNGQIFSAFKYHRALSPAEILHLHRDPLAPFRLSPLYISIPADTGGDTTLEAAAGSYGITGSTAGLLYSPVIAPATGDYAVTGTAASLLYGSVLTAESGEHVVSGATTSLLRGSTVVSGIGSYGVTGTDATLTYAAGLTIIVSAGSYLVDGSASDLLFGRKIIPAAGSFEVTGTAVSLGKGVSLSTEAGVYSVTGSDLGLFHSQVIVVSTGAMVVSGTDATLTYEVPGAWLLTAEVGSYQTSGTSANLLRDFPVVVGAGSFVVDGTEVELLRDTLVVTTAGVYQVTGFQVDLIFTGESVITEVVSRSSFVTTEVSDNTSLTQSLTMLSDIHTQVNLPSALGVELVS